MSDRENEKEHRQRVHGIASFIPSVRPIPAIGRITRPTGTPSKVMTAIIAGDPVTDLPGGGIVVIRPLYMLYVFRQNGQAGMFLNRIDPFQFEQMYLTELEMDVVMAWAMRMMRDDIGRFTPADGGWMWWRK